MPRSTYFLYTDLVARVWTKSHKLQRCISRIFSIIMKTKKPYVEVLTTVLQKWLAPLQMLEAELEPDEAITNYLLQKIEVSRTQPKASRLFALEVIQGAPHIHEILKGPLKKLVKRKAKVITMWQEQGKLSKQIDPELLILNIWAITQNYADFATQMEMVTGKTLRNRSMLQRVLKHTVHMMLYGIMPRQDEVDAPQAAVNTAAPKQESED